MDRYKVLYVLALLKLEGIESEHCSPNFVADFAFNRDVLLTSEEVVNISNRYNI